MASQLAEQQGQPARRAAKPTSDAPGRVAAYIDMDMDMMDKGMDDVNVAGGIPHFTYPERHSGYLEGIREVKDIIEVMLDEKKKKKKDRCHRKADQVYGTKTSAYKSGAIVKCRKGMIWKKKK